MSRSEKLFRAIVVMGVAVTAGVSVTSACFEVPEPCASCTTDARPDAGAGLDADDAGAGADSPSPDDADMDAVIII